MKASAETEVGRRPESRSKEIAIAGALWADVTGDKTGLDRKAPAIVSKSVMGMRQKSGIRNRRREVKVDRRTNCKVMMSRVSAVKAIQGQLTKALPL